MFEDIGTISQKVVPKWQKNLFVFSFIFYVGTSSKKKSKYKFFINLIFNIKKNNTTTKKNKK